jgi:PPOX class probable F420-dependent enzyme
LTVFKVAIDMVMTEGQERFIQEHRLAVLTTLRRTGSPQSTPVYYIYENGRLLVSSTRDRFKTINIQRDPRVSLCIVDETPPFRYVQVQGKAAVTEEDLVETSRRIYKTFRDSLSDDFPEQLVQQGRIIIEVTPEEVTPGR